MAAPRSHVNVAFFASLPSLRSSWTVDLSDECLRQVCGVSITTTTTPTTTAAATTSTSLASSLLTLSDEETSIAKQQHQLDEEAEDRVNHRNNSVKEEDEPTLSTVTILRHRDPSTDEPTTRNDGNGNGSEDGGEVEYGSVVLQIAARSRGSIVVEGPYRGRPVQRLLQLWELVSAFLVRSTAAGAAVSTSPSRSSSSSSSRVVVVVLCLAGWLEDASSLSDRPIVNGGGAPPLQLQQPQGGEELNWFEWYLLKERLEDLLCNPQSALWGNDTLVDGDGGAARQLEVRLIFAEEERPKRPFTHNNNHHSHTVAGGRGPAVGPTTAARQRLESWLAALQCQPNRRCRIFTSRVIERKKRNLAHGGDSIHNSGPSKTSGALTDLRLPGPGRSESILSPNAAQNVDTGPAATDSSSCGSPLQMKLPILDHLCSIVETIQRSPSRVTLLNGPTGCGKSTKVPLALLDADPRHVLWIAQPRRIAATSLCARLNQERGGSGSDAGYVIGGDRTESHSHSRVLFLTAGVLLQRFKQAFRDGSYLRDQPVTHLILDEVHERSVEYDVLLCLCREVLQHHRTIRLVLMSATMASNQFQRYMEQGCGGGPEDGGHEQQQEQQGVVGAGRNGTTMWPPTVVAENDLVGSWLAASTATAHGRGDTDSLTTGGGRESTSLVPVIHVPSLTTSTRTILYLNDMIQTLTQSNGDGYVLVPFQPTDVLNPPDYRTGLLWDARLKFLSCFIAFLHWTRPTEESILVFLPGLREIELLEEQLMLQSSSSSSRRGSGGRADETASGVTMASSFAETVSLILLHSANDPDREATRLFSTTEVEATTPTTTTAGALLRRRKIILSTNISESSLTIPTVDHVIDTCLVKEQLFQHQENLGRLEERYASKDSCEQRAGRTGRIRPGTVWRLVTPAEYRSFETARVPVILQCSLHSTVLLAADCNVGDVARFLAALPTPPPANAIRVAMEDLRGYYRAIAVNTPIHGSHSTSWRGDGRFMSSVIPTIRGSLIVALGMDVMYSHLVLLGVTYGSVLPCVQAAAILSAVAPIVSSNHTIRLADFDRGSSCDVVALVEIFRWWLRQSWATTVSQDPMSVSLRLVLRPRLLRDVQAKVTELLRTLHGYGLVDPVLLAQTAQQNPLTGCEVFRLIALLTVAFLHRTTHATLPPVLQRRSTQPTSRGAASDLFVPSHSVLVKFRGPVTSVDETALTQYTAPVPCSLARDSLSSVIVTLGFERRLDAYGAPVPLNDGIQCRLVRNVLYDAYRLIKMGAEERKQLHVAFTDAAESVCLLSTSFVASSAAPFLDRPALTYPLTVDLRQSTLPSVVACAASLRGPRAVIHSAVFLPGSLSFFPYAAACMGYWDGRTTDEASCCIVSSSLPHCHPSPRKLRKMGIDMDDMAVLAVGTGDFFGKNCSFIGRVGCERSVGGGGGPASSSSREEDEPAEVRDARRLVLAIGEDHRNLLDKVLLCFTTNVPSYFCSAERVEFQRWSKQFLPMHRLTGAMQQPDLFRSGGTAVELATPPRSWFDEVCLDAVEFGKLAPPPPPLPAETAATTASLLVVAQQNTTVSLKQLLSFRRAKLPPLSSLRPSGRAGEGGSTTPTARHLSYLGIPLLFDDGDLSTKSTTTELEEDARREVTVSRRYALTFLTDAMIEQSVTPVLLRALQQQQRLGSARGDAAGELVMRDMELVELGAQRSGGALGIIVAHTLQQRLQHLHRVASLTLWVGREFDRRVLGTATTFAARLLFRQDSATTTGRGAMRQSVLQYHPTHDWQPKKCPTTGDGVDSNNNGAPSTITTALWSSSVLGLHHGDVERSSTANGVGATSNSNVTVTTTRVILRYSPLNSSSSSGGGGDEASVQQQKEDDVLRSVLASSFPVLPPSCTAASGGPVSDRTTVFFLWVMAAGLDGGLPPPSPPRPPTQRAGEEGLSCWQLVDSITEDMPILGPITTKLWKLSS